MPGLNLALIVILIVGLAAGIPSSTASAATLLNANFNTDTSGFTYQDDAFGTSQPSYADGVRTTSGGYGSSGGLQVSLGGVNANTINGMSGGWSYTLNLAAAESGVKLSFRYKLDQTATYEFDEYSRVLVKLDTIQYGRGAKNYVDHIGGDGSSSKGNSSSFLPTTDWQQADIYLGDLTAGSHSLILGGYNNKKDASDESTTLVLDDVLLTSGNLAPVASAAQVLAERVDINQFLAFNQGIAQFDDRCRGSGMGCSSYDASATPSASSNYMKALVWVEGQLQAMGYTTVRHAFTSGTGGVNLYATKMGSVTPTEMYMISGHLDGRSGGDGFDDDGSAVALLLEIARVLSAPDVTTDKSVRFIFWDKEETGLVGSTAYASNTTSTGGRRALQGTLDEPTWLGLIQHDMILYDHGAGSVTTQQSAYADMDVEWRAGTTKEADSKALALKWAFLSGQYAPDYPATTYNYSTNTDDSPFHNYVASVSVRENRRSLTSGDTNSEWINPFYHTTSDVEASYTRDDDGDGKRDDIELGYNTVRVTLGLVAELAGARISAANNPPTADPQSVTTDEDTVKAITLSGSDPDSDPLTFQVIANPAHGTLTGTTPNLTYTPAGNYNGPDSFTFKVNDGKVDSAPATVSMMVNPVNDAPVANPQSLSTACNTPLAITLSGSDVDGDALSFSVTTSPALGDLSGTAPNLTYTPDGGTSGADSFDFTANDGMAASPAATVSLTVSACSGLGLPFSDDFESDRGWVVNPNGSDSASKGQWERADPQPTDESGPKQLGSPTSGSFDLVTGPLAGNNASRYDLDGGVTSIRSPQILLPVGQDLTLSFNYYFAHARNATSADYLRVQVVGSQTSTLLELRGVSSDVDAAWTPYQASLNSFAGQSVYLLIEAADLAKDSLVEAGLDDLSITAAAPGPNLLEVHFDSDSQGFSYLDDAFRGTGQPAYASGAYQAAGGYSGGGLQVTLGGVDDEIVTDISGGWQIPFTLAAPTNVHLSFWFKLTQSPDYEAEEYSQALVSLDGVLLGQGGSEYMAILYGNGNGGIYETTGWQLCSLDLGILPAGDHSLMIGAYNNQKTYSNESTELLIDDVLFVEY